MSDGEFIRYGLYFQNIVLPRNLPGNPWINADGHQVIVHILLGSYEHAILARDSWLSAHGDGVASCIIEGPLIQILN